jgi:hypothetical protein
MSDVDTRKATVWHRKFAAAITDFVYHILRTRGLTPESRLAKIVYEESDGLIHEISTHSALNALLRRGFVVKLNLPNGLTLYGAKSQVKDHT